MYLAFYKLRKNPFQISSDPEFLWLGDTHREALATLRYGVEDNKGFLLLTGDVGTGKTTLINRLLASLGDDVLAASVPDPSLEILDFYRYIAAVFGITEPFANKGEFLVVFRRFLEEAYAAGKKVVLIIDEAQRLTPELLEEIRLLSNIERPDSKLINIFFVGQNEFNGILLQPENRAIRQRITVNYDLKPLTIEETSHYIQHRLLVAGAKEPIFSPAAVQRIHAYARGYPRLINVIADRCLLTGFVDERPEIDAAIVLECAQELQIPAPSLPAAETVLPNPPAGSPTSTAAPKPATTAPPEQKSTPAEPPPPEPSPRRPLVLALLCVLVVGGMASGWYFFPQQSQNILTEIQATTRELAATIVGKLDHWRGTILASTPASPPEADTGGQQADDVSRPVAADTAPPRPSSPPSPSRPHPEPATPPSPPTPAPSGSPAGDRPLPDTAAATTSPAGIIEQAGPGSQNETNEPASAPAEIDPAFLNRTHVISFRHNSNTLPESGRALLDELYRHLQHLPYTMVEIHGYTDNLGTESYNQRLSLFRANLVKYYLLGKGVPEEKLTAIGEGSANPIASNETRVGRGQNRRVEIVVR